MKLTKQGRRQSHEIADAIEQQKVLDRQSADKHWKPVQRENARLKIENMTLRNERDEAIEAVIKRLADEAKVAMVMVSAMTRDAEKESRRPRKSDLRECGALESDADAILFLHRPADSEYTEFILAKHRFGPAGLANMRFDGSRTRYLDVPYEEREVQPEEKTTRRKRNRGDKPAAPPPQSPPSFYEPELEGIR